MGFLLWTKDLRKIELDNRASIEGLPLQLLIIGLIASLGTAIVVGWISSIEAPRFIGDVIIDPDEIILTDSDGDGQYFEVLEELTIRVLDTADKPVVKATVVLEGGSIDNEHHRVHGTTDSNGILRFESVPLRVTGNRISVISVSIQGQGIENEYRGELLIFPE